MGRLERLRQELQDIETEIVALSTFRDTPQKRHFLRLLHGQRSHILAEIKKITSSKEDKEKARQERIAKANNNRSEKNKRNWRYIRSIQENYFPDTSKKEIRSSFRKHKKGLDTDIPDVVWRNPSP